MSRNASRKLTSLVNIGEKIYQVYPVTIRVESAHDKTYNKTCVTSKDSDQPVHPPSMARKLVYPSWDSLEAVEDTCDQRRLISAG